MAAYMCMLPLYHILQRLPTRLKSYIKFKTINFQTVIILPTLLYPNFYK